MTRLKDSHAFWNKEYAGLDGVAIGFKKNVLRKRFSDKVCDVLYVELDKNIKLVDDALIRTFSLFIKQYYIIYSEHPNYLDVISSEKYTILSYTSDIFSSIIKHKSWKYERETRIVLADRRITQLTFEKEFIGGKKRVHYETLSKDVISSIMLGPACNDDQVEVIREYLEQNDYNNIPVSRSHAFDLKDTDFERL